MSMTNQLKQQYTLRISQANSTEMVVIIYEILLEYVTEAESLAASGDFPGVKEVCKKLNTCLGCLLDSLNLSYEPALQLSSLYLYCVRVSARIQLLATLARTEQDVTRTVTLLSQIEKVIVPLKDAYAAIAPQNTKGPVMNNSQTVYAGLTYGKNTLTENMTDQGTNRGLLV